MKLDRYTQKAQEAILGGQQLATSQQSPVLDVEHLLAALLDDLLRYVDRRASNSLLVADGWRAAFLRRRIGHLNFPDRHH